MNLGARPRGVGFPCTTAGSVVSAQDAYYGDIVAERELTCGCQSLEKEFAFASTGANAPETMLLRQGRIRRSKIHALAAPGSRRFGMPAPNCCYMKIL